MIMLPSNYSYAVCGLGPAGIGFLFSAYKLGVLPSMIEHGLVLIDKNEQPGSGDLRKFHITANTTCGTFLECIESDPKQLFQNLEEKHTNLIALLVKHKDEPIDLRIIGQFLEMISEIILNYISSLGATLLLKSEVREITLNNDATFSISLVDLQCENPRALRCNQIIANFGADQHTDELTREINNRYPFCNRIETRVVPSNTFLKESPDELAAKVRPTKNIVIIGSSHSSMSVIERISQLDLLRYPHIHLIYRNPIRLFYASQSDAEKDGYALNPAEDICPLTHGVNRYGGLRFNARAIGRQILKTGLINSKKIKVTQYQSNTCEEQLTDIFDKANMIIPCLGYTPNKITLLDQNRDEIGIQRDGLGYRTSSTGQLFNLNGKKISGLYSFGLGAGQRTSADIGGEKSFTKRVDGVWLYHFDIGQKIVKAVLSKTEP